MRCKVHKVHCIVLMNIEYDAELGGAGALLSSSSSSSSPWPFGDLQLSFSAWFVPLASALVAFLMMASMAAVVCLTSSSSRNVDGGEGGGGGGTRATGRRTSDYEGAVVVKTLIERVRGGGLSSERPLLPQLGHPDLVSGEVSAHLPQRLLSERPRDRGNLTDRHALEALVSSIPRADVAEITGSGTSNGRNLRFDLMSIAGGTAFSLHAHPNAELVYCLEGELHEIRLLNWEGAAGEPYASDSPVGPDLSGVSCSWEKRTLRSGEWLVNPCGSVHLTFTGAGGGCELLVLWSGKHANVKGEREPRDKKQIDEEVKLCQCGGSCWDTGDLFLPMETDEHGRGKKER